MKKILTTLAAVLCCTIITAVFTACVDNFDNPILPEEENNAIVDPLVVNTTNALSRFNYDNWREQTTIDIFDGDSLKLKKVNLPWASVAISNVPADYKHPERDVLVDGSTPKWQLAFNFCDWSELPDVNMFGLWDSHSQTMRIYSYIKELPNSNAKSCFYQITSSAKNYFDPYTRGWMPDSTTIAMCGWGQDMGGGLPVPSRTTGEILPITGTLDGEINPGWTCFELNFNTGIAQVKPDDNITFSLLGVQNIAFTGHMDLQGAMNSYGGKITIPGNKNKIASGMLSSSSSLFSSIASAIADGKGGAGILSPILGVIGGACSAAGGMWKAYEEGKSEEYSLNLNFNASATGEINGSFSSRLGTTVPPVQVDYDVLFGNIISHSGDANTSKITTGLWNLKRAPVIYVASDARYSLVEEKKGASFSTPILVSFLDPTSIELMLNEENILFPLDEVEKVSLLAYDFIFTDDQYSLSMQPYYDYYGIPKTNTIDLYYYHPLTIIQDYSQINQFMLDPDASLEEKKVRENSCEYSFIGTGSKISGNGMEAYNLMYSPLVGIMRNVGVSVVLEVTFKNGNTSVFADRFLPEIKAFSYMESPKLYDRLSSAVAPQTIAGVAFENKLFDHQKNKALNLLAPLVGPAESKYRLVSINANLFSKEYGIVIREYKDAFNPGLVIRTSKDLIGGSYRNYTLEKLHDVLSSLNDWDAINARLKKFEMPDLNNEFLSNEIITSYYNIQTGQSVNRSKDPCYIEIYNIDEHGRLTQIYW